MNKVVTRLQALGQKAAQLKQVVEAAPARAAQFRDAVHATTGQLQQLRADVQGTVTALKSDNDTSLAETLVELDRGTDVLARAGYELTGVDLEQGLMPRVIVHLSQVAQARTTPLDQLARECAGRRTLLALVNALIQAEATEEQVKLAGLTFQGLVVHIGAAPTVRLCWRRPQEEADDEVPLHPSPPVAAGQPPTPVGATPPPLPAYGAGSFFERSPSRTPAPTLPAPSEVPALPASTAGRVSPSTAKPTAEPTPSTGDWRKDALARFKKMPDLRK